MAGHKRRWVIIIIIALLLGSLSESRDQVQTELMAEFSASEADRQTRRQVALFDFVSATTAAASGRTDDDCTTCNREVYHLRGSI